MYNVVPSVPVQFDICESITACESTVIIPSAA